MHILVTLKNSTKDKSGLYSNELAGDILVTRSSRADMLVDAPCLSEGIKTLFRAKAMSISS